MPSSVDVTMDVGARDLLRILYQRHRGQLLVDLRYWYRHRSDPTVMSPSRRGIHIPASHITQVIAALNRIRDQMIREGVLEVEEGRPERFRPEVHTADF